MLKKALAFVTTLFLTLPAVAQLLDVPEVTPVDGMGEIHINFTTPITYLRHFPQDIGDKLRIFIDVTDPCADESIKNQESRNYHRRHGGRLSLGGSRDLPQRCAHRNRTRERRTAGAARPLPGGGR